MRSHRFRSSSVVLPMFLGLCVVLVLGGCAGRMEARFEHSNQMFLEQTVDEVDIGGHLRAAEAVPPGATVALVSLEKEQTSDHPAVAVIEDQMIRSLLTHGYRVMERDQDLLGRLYSERSGDRFRLAYLPSDVSIASVGGLAGYAGSGLASTRIAAGAAEATHISGLGRDTLLVYDTQLAPADYLVSYRVLECGIVYHKDSERKEKREGLVRLHMRVQRTSSGEVLMAENIAGSYEDLVRRSLLDDLAKYHYSFYSHDLPLQRGTRRSPVEMGSRSTGMSPGKVVLAAGAFGALLAVALTVL